MAHAIRILRLAKVLRCIYTLSFFIQFKLARLLSFVTERVLCARFMTEQPKGCLDLAALINDHGSRVVLRFIEELCIVCIYFTLLVEENS